MSIIIAIPCLLKGGTEMQTLSLAKVLRSCGHAVSVVCYFEHDESIVADFQKAGTTVRLLNMKRKSGFIRFLVRLRKEIRSIRPDVVHVQYMSPGALPIIASRLAGIKTVFATVHQPYTISHGRISKLILRTVSLFTTGFMAVSLNTEESWFGSCSMFDENKSIKFQSRHFTIYNSIDSEEIHKISINVDSDKLKKELGIPTNMLVIGAVSRLRSEKGIDLLIDAFKQLIENGMAAHLLIVGTGPDEKKLMENVKKYGIVNNVSFYGEADWERAMQLITIIDIVVVPSRFEGFGLTAAEAMAAGKPVIATGIFGLKEIVINEVTGLNFQIGNAISLEEKLKLLLTSPRLCKQYGNAGYGRVKSFFDIKVFQKKITTLYNYC